MYKVIGKRPGMPDECERTADQNLGAVYGDSIIGVALGIMPDGVVIEHCEDGQPAQYYETRGGVLIGVDAENPGSMETTRRAQPAYEMSATEWKKYLEEIGKTFARFVLHHNYGDRHQL